MTRIDVGSDPVIRVLLVDDHVAYRQAFAVALENETDFEVIGQASDYSGARSWLGDVDIILIGPSQSDGANRLVRELHSSNPNGKAVIFVSGADRREVALAIEAGAFGVLPISTDFTEVAVALRRVCEGDSLMAPQETIELLRMAADYRESTFGAIQAVSRLTPREIEILQTLAEGLADREIAERLTISTETVRTHFKTILSKLAVNSRIQALVFALRHGVVTIPKPSR